MMQTTSRIRHTKQSRPQNRKTDRLAPPLWLQSILETVALFVLPVTLLILLVLIALGINGNVSAQLEPQPSNLLAFAWLASGAA